MVRQNNPYLWLLAEGLHSTIMTQRMTENKRCQNASSTHNSLQSYNTSQILNLKMTTLAHSYQFFYTYFQSELKNLCKFLTVMQVFILCCVNDQIIKAIEAEKENLNEHELPKHCGISNFCFQKNT